MQQTILERGMLKTRIAERHMCVCTAVGYGALTSHTRRAWTSVFVGEGPDTCVVWLRFYDGPVSPGGLEEAHHAVVAKVRAGELPGMDVPEHEEVRGG